MRHHSKNRKFGRENIQRDAFIRSLVRNLISKGRITTTLPRAKTLRSHIEKLVTKARTNSVATRRLIVSKIHSEKEAKVLIEKIAPRYLKRAGGYTRIIKLPPRALDAAPMAMIEFV